MTKKTFPEAILAMPEVSSLEYERGCLCVRVYQHDWWCKAPTAARPASAIEIQPSAGIGSAEVATMDDDEPSAFSPDSNVRLWQVRQCLAELEAMGLVRRVGIDTLGRPLYELVADVDTQLKAAAAERRRS